MNELPNPRDPMSEAYCLSALARGAPADQVRAIQDGRMTWDEVVPAMSVTRRALIQRINRRLSRDELTLKVCRTNSRAHYELGDFYILNWRNCIVDKHLDLEAFGRELGALERWERLEIEEDGR